MTRWVESAYDHLVFLADPTGNGQVTETSAPPLQLRRQQAVTRHNQTFPSQTIAAANLGIAQSTISQAIHQGRMDNIKSGHWWEIAGMEFKTLTEASEYFQIPSKKLRIHAKKRYISAADNKNEGDEHG
jgi:hypothetical protein